MSVNDRWPVDFLNRQLAKLVRELSECQKWNESSLAGVREKIEDHATTGNALDCATVDMRLFVSAITSENSHQKIRNIQTALLFITADLESTEKHNYGKCVDCGDQIAQKRLEASPWVQTCTACQENRERTSPQRPKNKALKVASDRPRMHSSP